MDEEMFIWIGVLAFPVAIIALFFAIGSNGTTYDFNSTQFLVNGTNVSINSSILGNNTYTTINNTYINQTVNATVNSTQFDSNNPIHIKESWLTSFIEDILGSLDSVYCKLTGCTMSGNINMSGYNITNVGRTQSFESGFQIVSNATCTIIGYGASNYGC